MCAAPHGVYIWGRATKMTRALRMTTTDATTGSWARLELTRNSRANGNVTYRVCVEGNEQLRSYLRRTVMLDDVSFFMDKMPLRDLQHRMDGYLSQRGGRVVFPVYRLFELIEANGYRLTTNSNNDNVEVSMWRKDPLPRTGL